MIQELREKLRSKKTKRFFHTAVSLFYLVFALLLIISVAFTISYIVSVVEWTIFRVVRDTSHISFKEEVVEIFVEKDKFEIIGEYTFTNSSYLVQKQSINFPIGYENFNIEKVEFNDDLIEYEINGNSITFEITLSSKSEGILRIEYNLGNNDNLKYITKTTKTWKQPLDSAVFKIYNTTSCDVTTNYDFNLENTEASKREISSEAQNDKVEEILIFKSHQFWPNEDLNISLDCP
jgi:hypothetical protein